MAQRRFSLSIEGVSEELHVLKFSSTSEVNELFHCEVLFAVTEGQLGVEGQVGKKASLHLQRADGVRALSGVVRSFAAGQKQAERNLYRAVIVPEMAKLKFRKSSRIFAEHSVPEVIGRVMAEAGIEAVTMTLEKTYAKYPTLVQYEETDYDFIVRLCGLEGLRFYFSHETDTHATVFTDSTCLHDAVAGAPAVPFRAESGSLERGDCITRFEMVQKMHVASVKLDAYAFDNPSLERKVSAEAEGDAGLIMSEFATHYSEPELGERRAENLLLAHAGSGAVAQGGGSAAQLVVGHRFELVDPLVDALAGEYLITKLEEHGVERGFAGDDVSGEQFADDDKTFRFENHFECVPASVDYRPNVRGETPAMQGPFSALVVDPDGEEVKTDEHGRVMVLMRWDELEQPVWARVASPVAGKAWGYGHIPRVGEEVLVQFAQASPYGEVVVTGSLFNAQNVPPFALPDGATKTGLQSKSFSDAAGNFGGESPLPSGLLLEAISDPLAYAKSAAKETATALVKELVEAVFSSEPGPPDHNALYFDDAAEAQAHVLNVAKDSAVQIANDLVETVFNDVTREVKNNLSLTVGKDQTVSIAENRSDDVGGDETTAVKGTSDRTVEGDDVKAVGGNRALVVKATDSIEIGDKQTISIEKDREMQVAGAQTLSVGGSHSVTSKSDFAHEVHKGAEWTITQSASMSANQGITLKVGEATIEVSPSGITIKGSAPITIDGGSVVTVKAAASTKVKGAVVGIN